MTNSANTACLHFALCIVIDKIAKIDCQISLFPLCVSATDVDENCRRRNYVDTSALHFYYVGVINLKTQGKNVEFYPQLFYWDTYQLEIK